MCSAVVAEEAGERPVDRREAPVSRDWELSGEVAECRVVLGMGAGVLGGMRRLSKGSIVIGRERERKRKREGVGAGAGGGSRARRPRESPDFMIWQGFGREQEQEGRRGHLKIRTSRTRRTADLEFVAAWALSLLPHLLLSQTPRRLE